MRLLRVGIGMWVNADDVMLVQAFDTRPAARERARAENANQFYDATGGAKKRQSCRSLVTLRNGVVIASPVNAETLTLRPILEAPVTASTRRAAPPRETFEPDLNAQPDGTVHAIPRVRVPAPDTEIAEEPDAAPSSEPDEGGDPAPRKRRRRLFGLNS